MQQIRDEFVVALEIQIADVKKNHTIARFDALAQNLNGLAVPFEQRPKIFGHLRPLHHLTERVVRQVRNDSRRQSIFRRSFDDQGELRRRLGKFHSRLGRRILRSIDDVAPPNQICERRGIETELFLRNRRNQLGARLVVRFVKHVLGGSLAEMFRIRGCQERALMVVEPPRHLRRIRILEVHDDVFIAIEEVVFPRLSGAVGHAREAKFRVLVKLFPVEAVKKSGGSRAIEAAIVETEPDLGHDWAFAPSLSQSQTAGGTKPSKMYACTTIVKKKYRQRQLTWRRLDRVSQFTVSVRAGVLWQNAVVLQRLTERKEWKFFGVLPKADPGLAAAWWTALLLRGILPAAFAIAMGVLVGAVQRGDALAGPLAFADAIFVLLQVLSPIHQAVSANLGDRTAAWLYDRLTEACVHPPGMGHLEDPTLTSDLTVARDFDLGMTGPPLSISLDFIASGMAEMIGGVACAVILARYAWWAPIVLAGAWLATHWLLRESAIWRDRNTEEVRGAQRDADYAYRLAVDPPAGKELRLFGLAAWTIDRFIARRTRLHELQYAATRLRERPVIWSLLLVVSANVLVFWLLASAAAHGRISLGEAVVYVQSAVGVSMIAFGGFSWALDGAAAPVAAVLRLEPAMRPAGALRSGDRPAGITPPTREIRLRDVTFAYPAGTPVLEHFDLTIPAGSSLAIVGQNGAGKTTIAKLLCRLYDPQAGAIEIDGVDLRELDLASWRARVAAVFQDFIRLELPLRDNVAPAGAPDDVVRAALESAGATNLAALDTVLARGYSGGTDLSGGQWQRVALARALAAVKLGAGVVLLDEPTAQLDVRGEAEIFDRLLAATRHCTTILISHRFSTVRHADRICVLEHGRVIEFGTHDELMALAGRYRTMFDLQAQRFKVPDEELGTTYDVLT